MRTSTAQERHRAHHIRFDAPFGRSAGRKGAVLSPGLVAVAAAAAVLSGAGCGGLGNLPRPRAAQVAADDYVPVPFSPRVPPVEFIPPSPSKKAVWVDGSWEWSGSRYGWRYGSWVIPPDNARRARWVVVRRQADGQLFFAPSSWKDASGNTIDERSFADALGPSARARSRIDGAPPTEATDMSGGRGSGASGASGARTRGGGQRGGRPSRPSREGGRGEGRAETGADTAGSSDGRD